MSKGTIVQTQFGNFYWDWRLADSDQLQTAVTVRNLSLKSNSWLSHKKCAHSTAVTQTETTHKGQSRQGERKTPF